VGTLNPAKDISLQKQAFPLRRKEEAGEARDGDGLSEGCLSRDSLRECLRIRTAQNRPEQHAENRRKISLIENISSDLAPDLPFL